MKQFLFLYPIKQYIDNEIERGAYSVRDNAKEREFLEKIRKALSEEEKESLRKEAKKAAINEFREMYKTQLNACMDARYRQNGFGICYAVFDGSPVSDVVEVRETDRVIQVGLDYKTHTTRQPNGEPNGEFPYANPDYILDQLGEIEMLRIGGFHMWDCVERVASRAYERRLDVLVDEDLTEWFAFRLGDPDFKIDRYPTYNARNSSMFDAFMEARKDKPWLWQEY